MCPLRAFHERRGGAWLAIAAILAAAALLIGFWVWRSGAESRAIHDLPAPVRAQVYLHTLANLKTLCDRPDGAFDDYCRRQAAFIIEFPECDDACLDIAGRHREHRPRAR
jgi:hypothetical protein